MEAPSLGGALEASASRGAATIVLEAGPSTTRSAYREGRVDELMLSLFHGPFDGGMNETIAPFAMQEIELALPHASARREHLEPSGRWSFQRRWRARHERPEGQ